MVDYCSCGVYSFFLWIPNKDLSSVHTFSIRDCVNGLGQSRVRGSRTIRNRDFDSSKSSRMISVINREYCEKQVVRRTMTKTLTEYSDGTLLYILTENLGIENLKTAG